MRARPSGIGVVIPTFRREDVLLETVDRVLRLRPGVDEVVVVDQTRQHDAATEQRLAELASSGAIRWLRQEPPSIPKAMNRGLCEATAEIVLFLDDDVLPCEALIEEHLRLHTRRLADLVAGRVIQPWHPPVATETDSTAMPSLVDEFMGGNFSVRRAMALDLGGFDENFVRVAYRFEAEFASRLRQAGGRILFNPAAFVHHLKTESGGTREYGVHYRTIRPDHAVGEYYYLLRGAGVRKRVRSMLVRPVRAVSTRFHLRRPWWIPVTFASELAGFGWAVYLALRGPKYLERPPS